MPGRILQLLGTQPMAAARHVAFLTDELEIAGWHVETAGPRGALGGEGHLDHVVDAVTAGSRLAHRHLRMLAASVDAVHAHGRTATELAVTGGLRVPIVSTWYAEELDTAARADRRLSRHVAAVIAASPGVAARADDRARVVVIRPAVGPPRPVKTRNDARAELGLDVLRPIVMTYGPLVSHAGLETVLDAAIVLQQEAPGLSVAIVGAGPLERDLRIEVAALGLSSTVIIAVPNLPLAEVVAVADLLVVPSPLPAEEGMVIDAMALGRPVMAAKGALPETLLTHGETGYLVTPGHGQALASAIADLFARPAVMAELAENARRRVTQMNDAQVLVDAVAAVYRLVAS